MQADQTPPIPEPAIPPVPAASAAAPQAVPTPGASPEIADDGDLIEKEWVNKVKQLVAATAQDPFEQSRQFSLLKADYLQKRYGKTVKTKEQ